VGPVIRALERRVLADFGDTPQAGTALADFGFAPPTVSQPTADTKATAVEKRRATREARHTMGKNPKKNVKGTVAAPSPTPSGPSPAPAAATPVTGTPHA
jgi:hypothetical protein